MNETLEIVNEEGKVIGLDTRKNIHAQGLLHREINVWFFTPDGNIILQKRSATKDMYPNLLDSTVGGHVEKGMDFDDTVLKEIKEEVGLDINPSDLIFITVLRSNSADVSTGNINNTIKKQYAYRFLGDISELKVEEGEATGFELWKIDDVLNVSEQNRSKFIPRILKEPTLEILRTIKSFCPTT